MRYGLVFSHNHTFELRLWITLTKLSAPLQIQERNKWTFCKLCVQE